MTEPFDKNIVNNLLLGNLDSKYLDNPSELLNETVVSYYNQLNISPLVFNILNYLFLSRIFPISRMNSFLFQNDRWW